MWWDGQESVLDENGGYILLDEDYSEWPISECERREEPDGV